MPTVASPGVKTTFRRRTTITSALPTNATDASAKSLLLAMRQVAPPILYYESPLSYMTENPAKKFYDGEELPEDQRVEGAHLEHDGAAQNVINYCVIQARYETAVPPSSIINSSINGERVPGLTRPVVGARLVGMVPCSDAFGFDILISDYQAAVKKAQE